MSYAIISLGGKQYRVREGQRLLVDRLPHEEQKTFHPDILLIGGNGEAELAPKGVQVTARIVRHTLGEKIRIGKYRPKTGYKRHTGHRSRLSQIQIETIGKKAAARTAAKKAEPAEAKPKAAAKPKVAAKPKAEAKPKPPAKKPAAARKPAAKKKTES